VPIISNGVLIWAPIIAHYYRFISSFGSASLVFLRLFLQSSSVGDVCAHCLLCFPEREIFLKTDYIIMTLAIDLIWAPNHIEVAEADR